jgi:hypothetical protein
VPCAHDAALQKRECGLDGIRMNVAHDICQVNNLDSGKELRSGSER